MSLLALGCRLLKLVPIYDSKYKCQSQIVSVFCTSILCFFHVYKLIRSYHGSCSFIEQNLWPNHPFSTESNHILPATNNLYNYHTYIIIPTIQHKEDKLNCLCRTSPAKDSRLRLTHRFFS